MSNTTNDEKVPSTDIVTPKSPLEFSWTFWYLKPDKRISWEKSLIRLIDVGFVEDFWATFNHLAVPSRLASGKINSDYYFFKKDSKTLPMMTFIIFVFVYILVRPMWGTDNCLMFFFFFYLFVYLNRGCRECEWWPLGSNMWKSRE